MDDTQKKLNKEYAITIQGGSLLLIIGMLASKAAQLDIVAQIAQDAGIKNSDTATTLAVIDTIGSAISEQAVKIFGREYVAQILSNGFDFDAYSAETLN